MRWNRCLPGIALSLLCVTTEVGWASPAPSEFLTVSPTSGEAPLDVRFWVYCRGGDSTSASMTDHAGVKTDLTVIQTWYGTAPSVPEDQRDSLTCFGLPAGLAAGTYSFGDFPCNAGYEIIVLSLSDSPQQSFSGTPVHTGTTTEREECDGDLCTSGTAVTMEWSLPSMADNGWVALAYLPDSNALGGFQTLKPENETLRAAFFMPDGSGAGEICPIVEIQTPQGVIAGQWAGPCVNLLAASISGCSGCAVQAGHGQTSWFVLGGVILIVVWRRKASIKSREAL